MGRLTPECVHSVVVTTTRLLWSYVTDAINVFILAVLPPQEVLPCMGDLSFAKNIKGILSMKAVGI